MIHVFYFKNGQNRRRISGRKFALYRLQKNKHVLAPVCATPWAIFHEFLVWVRTVTPHLYSGFHPCRSVQASRKKPRSPQSECSIALKLRSFFVMIINWLTFNENCANHPMNTVCISTKMTTPEKVGGTKHRASPALQKVGGHVPLSTHGSTPMDKNNILLGAR